LALGGGRTTPKPLGVVRPPQKAKKKNNNKKIKVGGFWGWPDHPQRPGVASATHTVGIGWLKPPPGPWGRSDHPQKPKTHFLFCFVFFFFFGNLGVAKLPNGHPCHHCSLFLFLFFFLLKLKLNFFLKKLIF
jgi:hypothetical protein